MKKNLLRFNRTPVSTSVVVLVGFLSADANASSGATAVETVKFCSYSTHYPYDPNVVIIHREKACTNIPAPSIPLGVSGGSTSGAGHNGASSGTVAQQQSKDQATQKDTNTTGPCDGNPVMLASGNKVEFETDKNYGGDYPLTLERIYNRNSSSSGLFGNKWISPFDRRAILSNHIDAITPGNIVLLRSDGSQLRFNFEASSGNWYPAADGELPTARLRVVKRISSNPLRFQFIDGDGHVETYAGGGSILSSVRADGVGLTFTYGNPDAWVSWDQPNTTLNRVTHTNGRFFSVSVAGGNVNVADAGGNVYTYSKDSAGYLTTVTYPPATGGNSDVITYHWSGNLYLGKSINGRRYSTFTYDSLGRVESSEHAGGVERHAFTYNADGSTTVLKPSGREVRHWFDSAGMPFRVEAKATSTCPLATTNITRSNSGQLVSTTLPNGLAMESTIDAEGYVVQEVRGKGTALEKVTVYTWEGMPRRLSRITTPLTITSFTYDGKRRETSRTQQSRTAGLTAPVTTVTSYSDYPNGLPSSITVDGPVAGSGDAVTYYYNANGDLATVVDAVGTTSFSDFTASGMAQTVVDPNNVTTTLRFDSRDRLITKSIAGMTWNWTYTADSQLLTDKGPDNVQVMRTYDDALRLYAENKYDSFASSYFGGSVNDHRFYTYDLSSDLVKVETRQDRLRSYCPSYPCTSYGMEYVTGIRTFIDRDSNGNVLALRGNSGQSTMVSRNAAGQVDQMRVASELGTLTTQYGYDALKRLETVTDPKSGVLIYGYNSEDEITSITDPKGGVTSYEKDGLGYVGRIVSPDTGVTAVSYRSDGLPHSTSAADGTTIVRSYTPDGRLSTLQASRGGQSTTRTYTYDNCMYGKSRICSIVESTGERLDFTYTSWGAIASQTAVVQGQSFTTTWSYDAAGQMSALTYPSGLQVRYTWQAGQPRQITAYTTTGSPSTIINNVLYQPFGRAIGFRGVNYDVDGRLSQIAQPSATAALTYSARDLVTGTGSLGLNNITYDEVGQIQSAVDGTGTSSAFSYDKNGNRTVAVYSPGGSATYDFAPGTNRLTSVSSAAGVRNLAYDSAGNLTSDQRSGITDCHRYDAFARLSQFERYSGTISCSSAAAGTGSQANYLFNGLNQRSFKQAGGVVTRYIYAPTGELLYEISGNGQQRSYVWFEGRLIAVNTNATSHSSTYAAYSDHLGRPTHLVNSQNATVWSAKVRPFDRAVTSDSIGGFNLGFPGQYFDSESGLWQNWHRTYDGTLGRYTQPDPIGLAGGINPYAYAEGNPIDTTDPTGEVGFIGGIAGAGVELGMQALKNYKKGCAVFDIGNYDWGDVVVSGAVGAFAPGMGTVGKTAWKSGNAIKTLSSQATNTVNRAAKIQSRISDHKRSIKEVVATQGAYQAGKSVGKAANGSDPCECER